MGIISRQDVFLCASLFSVERIAFSVLRGVGFWFKNGGSARSNAQVLKKREKKEEKGLKKEEKLQEVARKREKQRKVGHFGGFWREGGKKHARLMLCGRWRSAKTEFNNKFH